MKITHTLILCLCTLTVLAQNSWVKVEAGAEFTLALKSDGTLWGWGFNANGQLTGSDQTKSVPIQISDDTHWVDIAVGAVQSFAIKEDGSLWGWGYNLYGQLGIGSSAQAVTSIQRVGTDTNWVQVEAGFVHTLARKSDGSIWTCGYNITGQLGNAEPNEEVDTFRRVDNQNYIDIATGGFHSLAIRSDSTLWGWGDNSTDQINGRITTDVIQRPSLIDSLQNWTEIECGYQYSAALNEEGRLYTWGFNGNGQLGLGATPTNIVGQPTVVDSNASWIFISPGASFMHAIRPDSTLWAWGFNGLGQLGIGNETQQNSPIQVGEESDWYFVSNARGLFFNNSLFGLHTVGLRGDGRSICASGANYQSQLGNGNTVNLSSFDCSILDLSVSTLQPTERVVSYTIYPNPAYDQLTIESKGPKLFSAVQLFSLNGQNVQRFEFNETSRATINIDHIPEGLYFLQLLSKDGTDSVFKVLIK